MLYRGRVDFRDGGRVIIHCYTEVGLISAVEGIILCYTEVWLISGMEGG